MRSTTKQSLQPVQYNDKENDSGRGQRRAGMVVVGWLGRASTTLHYTLHVSHAGSRNTAVSFCCPSFLLFQQFKLWSVLSNFLVTNLPERTVKLRPKSLDKKDCRCFLYSVRMVSTLPPVPATNRRVVQDRLAVEGLSLCSSLVTRMRKPLSSTLAKCHG